MKYLEMGTGSSQFVKEIVEYVLDDSKNQIYVTYNRRASDLFVEFYDKKGVNLIDTHERGSLLSKIPKLGVLANLYREVKRTAADQRFDVIHVHSMNNYIYTYFAINILGKYADKIICTYYGSDIFTKSEKELKRFSKLIEKIDVITMASDNMIKRFEEAYDSKYTQKIKKVAFGLSGFSNIDRTDDKYKELENKFVVAIGHNNCVEQQHLEVLSQIEELKPEIQKNITIVLQLTYGNGSEEYINEIREKINNLKSEVVCFTEYMNGYEIAKLINSVDVYVNSQKTDALSGAMLEYLYGKTTVLNPVWIDYSDLDTLGINYLKYDNFNQVPNLIEAIYNDEIIIDTSLNHDIIKENYHWENQREKWKEILK